MPASGGMGGVSIAQPQDLTSGLNGNPATLTQFPGTQSLFGGAWAEPTFNLTQTGNIPAVGPALIEPFSGKSTAPGVPIGNIGITQDFSELGLPVTLGIGFVTTSGVVADFRNIPESHGSNAALAIFSLPVAVGVDLNDRLSVGASVALGLAFFDGPFVGAGGMTPDYALRGTLGPTISSPTAPRLAVITRQDSHSSSTTRSFSTPARNKSARLSTWTCRRTSASVSPIVP